MKKADKQGFKYEKVSRRVTSGWLWESCRTISGRRASVENRAFKRYLLAEGLITAY